MLAERVEYDACLRRLYERRLWLHRYSTWVQKEETDFESDRLMLEEKLTKVGSPLSSRISLLMPGTESEHAHLAAARGLVKGLASLQC